MYNLAITNHTPLLFHALHSGIVKCVCFLSMSALLTHAQILLFPVHVVIFLEHHPLCYAEKWIGQFLCQRRKCISPLESENIVRIGPL